MMVVQNFADPQQLLQRGGQRPLLHATLAHHIAQQVDTQVAHLGERIGARFPLAKLPDHVGAVQQYHPPAQQPAASQRILALTELADMVIYQRFKFVLAVLGVAAELIDKVTP